MSLPPPASQPSANAEAAARLYPAHPHLAVSVAVFRAGRVLLARRGQPPHLGAFSLPGGLVEVGETLAAAALRELREEVAVEARITGFNQWVESIERDAAGLVCRHYVIASFTGVWLRGEARPGPEAGEILWALPADLDSLETTAGLACIVRAAALSMRQAADGAAFRGPGGKAI
ncbi:MAG TPA: NUDIX hydrolase [Methylocella sp.]|nr:NUDIX hydrolase [Methylocella sp.]